MDNAVKVSVIMPVYKVEKFVGKAIESMLSQTLSDFEFLIVDDGTPDNSGKICDEYAQKDSRIRVFHRENGGAPSARNMAMEEARGKYYYFMDSDDWAEPTMLQDMVELAEKHEAQLVVTGFFIDTYYNDTEYLSQNQVQPDAVYDQKAFRENAYKLFDTNLLYTPWNKLYLRAYIDGKGLRFPQTIWDDFPFNLSVIRDVEKVVVSSKQYYHFMRARRIRKPPNMCPPCTRSGRMSTAGCWICIGIGASRTAPAWKWWRAAMWNGWLAAWKM